MIIAMYYHLFPTREEAAAQQCTCAWHSARVASAT
jgi:hypothetical protein